MTDEQKIELVVGLLTTSLMHNKLEDLSSYMKLAKKIALTIDAELVLRQGKDRYREIIKTGWNARLN